MLHTKVNAVDLRFVNKEIFQRVVAVGWRKRFFADLAVNRTCRMLRLRPHANELIPRGALRTKEIDCFGHKHRLNHERPASPIYVTLTMQSTVQVFAGPRRRDSALPKAVAELSYRVRG